MESPRRPHVAASLIAASLLLGAFVRVWLWWSSGFLFGPVLGGLTPAIVIILPGPADVTVPLVALAEVVLGLAAAAIVGIHVANLLRGGMLPARWKALTWWLAVLVAWHLTTVLAVLPYSGLKLPSSYVMTFVATSFASFALVLAAWPVGRPVR
jgi:hypothetical protein